MNFEIGNGGGELGDCLVCSKLGFYSINSGVYPTTSVEDACLREHLWVVFTLRKVLGISKEECGRLLRLTGGGNPGGWIALCSECSRLVKNAAGLNNQIMELEKDLQLIKEAIRAKAEKSLGMMMVEGRRRRERESGGGDGRITIGVHQVIRDYLKGGRGGRISGDREHVDDEDESASTDVFKPHPPDPVPKSQIETEDYINFEDDFEPMGDDDAEDDDDGDLFNNSVGGGPGVDQSNPGASANDSSPCSKETRGKRRRIIMEQQPCLDSRESASTNHQEEDPSKHLKSHRVRLRLLVKSSGLSKKKNGKFECTICGHRFNQKHSLQSHVRQMHVNYNSPDEPLPQIIGNKCEEFPISNEPEVPEAMTLIELVPSTGVFLKKCHIDAARMLAGDVNYTVYARHLFRSVFSSSELTGHSLFGKKCNANGSLEPLPQVDPAKRDAVINFILQESEKDEVNLTPKECATRRKAVRREIVKTLSDFMREENRKSIRNLLPVQQ